MTIIYNVALGTGTSSAALNTGGSIRYGILFAPASALIGQQIATWKTNLRKALTPSGNVTCKIYDSGNNVVATANETVDSTTLPTSFANYVWTFTTPRTIASNDRLVIEYSGATRIDIEIYNTDQYDGANTLRTRWTTGPSWVNGTTEDAAGEITNGQFITSTTTHRYNINMTACNMLMTRYAILTKATGTTIHRYGIRQLATSTTIHRYAIRTLVSKVLISRYSINRLSTASVLIARYAVRTLTGQKTTTHRYAIRTKVTSTLTSLYHIRRKVTSTLTATYRILMKTTTAFGAAITSYLYDNWSVTNPTKEDIS